MKVAQLQDLPPAVVLFVAEEPEPAPGQTRPKSGSDAIDAVVKGYLVQDPAPEIVFDFTLVRQPKINGYDIGDMILAIGYVSHARKTPVVVAASAKVLSQLRQRAPHMFEAFDTKEEALEYFGGGQTAA